MWEKNEWWWIKIHLLFCWRAHGKQNQNIRLKALKIGMIKKITGVSPCADARGPLLRGLWLEPGVAGSIVFGGYGTSGF